MQPVPHGPADPRYTLGVVIPVPEPERDVLRGWRERYGGAPALEVDPHITLVTGYHQGRWRQAAAHVRRVAASQAPFDIRLGAALSFRPASAVVYLPLLAGAGQCRVLHAHLLRGPLRHDSAFDYHPHLTIAQNLPEPALDAAQHELAATRLEFRAEQISLFAMGEDGWDLREQLPLGG